MCAHEGSTDVVGSGTIFRNMGSVNLSGSF